MKVIYAFFYFTARTMFRLFYRHRVYGLENFIPGAAIIAPNHASYLDPPIVSTSCPEEVHFLARKSLFKSLLGTLISNLNAHPVSGSVQDLGSLKLICQLLNEGKKVIIFPEGTRSSNGELIEIKPGIGMLAMRAMSPIIPVYVHGTYEAWGKKRKFPKIFARTACLFGKPIYCEDFSHLDKKTAQVEIAKAVAQSIQELKMKYEQNEATL